MARNKMKPVAFRRKREGRTDYRKRMELLKSGKPRLIVRKSSKSIIMEIAEYSDKGDRILASASSTELKKMGWGCSTSNLPAAYLTGLLLSSKKGAKDSGECILDTGMYKIRKGNKIFAALKGAVDGGIIVPHKEDMFPDDDRVSGKNIEEFAKKASSEKEKYPQQFSKSGSQDITSQFESVKKAIAGK